MLKIENLTKYYGNLKAVDNLSLEVKKGEIFGFIGPNGAGKSTTMKCIMNQINKTSGKIYMNYITYTINVKNNTDTEILLTDSSNNKEICLVDSNDSEYISYINEIPQYNLTIEPGEQKTLDVRFNKVYSSNVNIRRITFKNIYLDYEKYKNGEESEKIKVDIEI